ncbi:MAG: ParB N-terminal domain-containing protein [Eubacteriales bacterium]
MRVKDGQPKIQFQTFADMINFPVKPGEQPETSTFITEVLPLELLEGYPNHEEHFPLYTGARLSGMISSIQKHGVQTPILVWKTTDGRHIIISGHNRVNASKLAGLTTVSAVIRTDLTPKMAEDLFFEMNFQQRSLSDLRFSQRVLCVAAHYNVMKQQGRRTDLLVARVEDDDATSPDCQEKLHTDAKVAEEYELTRDKISKYCRLATLYRPLLLLLDESKKIGQLAAYEISVIENSTLQACIHQVISQHGATVSREGQAAREEFEQGKLDQQRILELLACEKPAKPDRGLVSVRLPEAAGSIFRKVRLKRNL